MMLNTNSSNYSYCDFSGKYDGDFNDFFECFILGEVPFGDYFDHIADWYEARNDPTTKILLYEQMMDSPNHAIVSLADFLHVNVTPQNVMVSFLDYYLKMLIWNYWTQPFIWITLTMIAVLRSILLCTLISFSEWEKWSVNINTLGNASGWYL